jgi:hypothetical protein
MSEKLFVVFCISRCFLVIDTRSSIFRILIALEGRLKAIKTIQTKIK